MNPPNSGAAAGRRPVSARPNFNADLNLYTPFAAELSVDALAYSGLGPRFLVQQTYVYYDPETPLNTAFLLNVGGVGGFEARLGDFGVLLELDVSLPALGLIGPYFRVFPTEAFSLPKLTLGANYFF